MKNTIILILSLLVIGLGSYVIFDKVINKSADNGNSDKKENSNNSQVVANSYVGTYTSDKGDGSAPSSITFNEDYTFEFLINVCSGMIKVNGKYKVSDSKIELSDFDTPSYKTLETNLRGKTTLEFGISSKQQIYLMVENFGCVTGNGVNDDYPMFTKNS